MTGTDIALPLDIRKSFESIAGLEQAAKDIKSKRNDGILKAYCLIIAHLETNEAGVIKRDPVAIGTYEELVKLNVPKSKARRYIENSQAWRRNEEVSSSKNPEENHDEMERFGIKTESALKNFLFPKQTVWTEKPAKYLAKQWQDIQLAKGELEADKAIHDMMLELAAAYKAERHKAERNRTVVNTVRSQPAETPEKDQPSQPKKRQSRETKQANPKAARKRK